MDYWVYRPGNLGNSPANKVPLVVWLDEQTSPKAVEAWESLAIANRFVIVVYRPGLYRLPKGESRAWFSTITSPTVSPSPGCGANGTGLCDDKPGLLTLLKLVVREQNVRSGRISSPAPPREGTSSSN